MLPVFSFELGEESAVGRLDASKKKDEYIPTVTVKNSYDKTTGRTVTPEAGSAPLARMEQMTTCCESRKSTRRNR